MNIKIIIAAILLALSISACGEGGTAEGSASTASSERMEAVDSQTPFQQTFFAMDTVMSLTAYGPGGEEAVRAGMDEVLRLDAMLSTGSEESEIGKLNRDGKVILSEEACELTARSLEFAEITDGAFDIAIYPIMEAWGFTEEEQHVPPEEEIQRLLPLCRTEYVHLDPDSGAISFSKPGVRIDLGGSAKGYTSGRIMDIYRACGVKSGLVNLGGNVQTLGRKPDGSLWRIAVEDPDGDGKLGVLLLEDRAAITSGGYERFFEADGNIYHHIIDPETGYPAEKGLKSVTIVSEDGTMADILSTSLFIMGAEKAEQFCLEHAGEFEAVLYTNQGELIATQGLKDNFTSDHIIRFAGVPS